MITEIQIQGQPIDIPNDLEIMLDEISPLKDTTITTGDFSQSFEIPASPQNRRTLQYVDQIHLADKTIRFDDVVIVDDYFGTIRGSILIQETISEFGSGSIDADFFTNLLSIDVFNKKLADVMQLTAKADLGTTPAAIIAAAKGQNAADMSADGATGAVLKFVPHFNPEFFDADINPDWNPNATQYNSTQAYSVDDVVIYQQKSAFDQPEKYICISAAAIGETPETHPAKWQKIPFCVLNDWDPDAGAFYLNETEKIGNRYFQNFHALVPWIQLHDVIRKAALSIGYSIDGDYLQDSHEQRALLVSNFAQVKPAEYRALLQLNNVADENVLSLPQSGGPTGTLADAIVQDPAAENDAESLFDDTAQEFTVNKKGVYRIRFAGFIWADENGVDDVQLFFNLFDDLANNLAFGKQVFPVGSFPDGSTTQEFEIEIIYEYDYAGDDGTQDLVLELRSEVQDTDTLGAVLTNTFISFENITYQGVDQYDGTVYYRDHVPDITVANFLEAIRTWKNLMVSFDGRRKIISFNYADTIITQRKDVLNLDPYQVGGHRLKLKPKKKFKLNYGVLPENTETIFTNYQVGDAVDKIQDLNGYILNNDISPTSKKAILVKSLNAWMLTGASKYSDRTVWTLFSHNWPDLEIEETGDLYEITPELGPVPMGFFKAFSGDLFQAPVLSGLGRSSGQPLAGERPKFMVAYWVGVDTSTISAGYPLATTTKTRSDGTALLNKSMSWMDQYESFWIKTLRAIVQEEIIIRSFMIPPEINQKIKWQTIALISHSPTLIMKKLRSIGSSPMQQMEMRRIKSQEIEVVSQNVVVDDDDGPVYTPGLYTQEEVENLIANENYIPVASASEFDLIDSGSEEEMGVGTPWQGQYTTGVDKKYIQVSAIDFNSFGTWSSAHADFEGVYDGNELNVINLTQTDCIFGNCQNGAEIENCRFAGSYTVNDTGSDGKGPICDVFRDGKFNNNKYIGDVENAGAASFQKLGGLIGELNSTSSLEFDNNEFNGNISFPSGSGAGGCIGAFVAAPGGSTIQGNLTSGTMISVSGNSVGGFCPSISSNISLSHTNNMDISVVGQAAGVVFTVSGMNFIDCVNNGDISGTGLHVGGICASGGASTFSGCENNGNITNTSTSNSSSTAGIVAINYSELINCKNTGSITGRINVGGIVGLDNTTSLDIEKCYSTGDITATFVYAGGICGRKSSGSFVDCWASGDLNTGSGTQGGLLGVLTGNVTFTNSFAFCTFSGSGTHNGGLVGRVQSGSATDSNSYWDTDIGTANSPVGTGKTTSELQTPTTNSGIYSAWTIPPWDFGTSSDYPELTTTP